MRAIAASAGERKVRKLSPEQKLAIENECVEAITDSGRCSVLAARTVVNHFTVEQRVERIEAENYGGASDVLGFNPWEEK